jgi:hypothetical protein
MKTGRWITRETRRSGRQESIMSKTFRALAVLAATVAMVTTATGAALASANGAQINVATQVRTAATASAQPAIVGEVCAFTGSNYAGTEQCFPTADYHSKWIDFDSVVGFHPNSLADDSNSDIWLKDAQTGAYTCLLGGYGISEFINWQPGWFYIQYNVNTCATPPPDL